MTVLHTIQNCQQYRELKESEMAPASLEVIRTPECQTMSAKLWHTNLGYEATDGPH